MPVRMLDTCSRSSAGALRTTSCPRAAASLPCKLAQSKWNQNHSPPFFDLLREKRQHTPTKRVCRILRAPVFQRKTPPPLFLFFFLFFFFFWGGGRGGIPDFRKPLSQRPRWTPERLDKGKPPKAKETRSQLPSSWFGALYKEPGVHKSKAPIQTEPVAREPFGPKTLRPLPSKRP